MTQQPIQIIGLVRFSILANDFYIEKFGSVENVAAHIFSPERLELRFQLFETLCLPSLLRQSDQSFMVLVLTSSLLPPPAMERLEALLAPHENLHLMAAEPGPHYTMISRAFKSVPRVGFDHRISFRLDDDDAVDGDFIKRLQDLGRGLLGLYGGEVPTVIAHNRGFYVEKTRSGAVKFIDAVERTPLSVGTALLAPSDFRHNPYRYNHRHLLQRFNTYSDITVPGFIRSIHRDNKSSPSRQGFAHRMDDEEIARDIRRHFGLEIGMLRQLL